MRVVDFLILPHFLKTSCLVRKKNKVLEASNYLLIVEIDDSFTCNLDHFCKLRKLKSGLLIVSGIDYG